VKVLAWTFLGLLAAAGALYAGLLVLLWWKQEALLFHPQRLPAEYRLAAEPDVHERTVQVPGARLSVLHLQRPGSRGVVFFLHGNAGNLAGWFSNTQFYRDAGFDLVMPDYRGYGKSTGAITSAEQLRADVRAVWTASLTSTPGAALSCTAARWERRWRPTSPSSSPARAARRT